MIEEIKKRYSILAEENDSLSCGKVLQFVFPGSGDICLDLGCGRGTDVLALAKFVGTEGFVYGVDITEKMIIKAKKNAQISNTSNVKFIQCPFENLPLKSSSVDLIISNCAINHSQNKFSVWNEMYRVLKSHGKFVVSDIYSVIPISQEFRNNPEFVADCWAGAVTRNEYIDQIFDVGFNEVSFFYESKPYVRGKVELVSFVINGIKPSDCSSSCS